MAMVLWPAAWLLNTLAAIGVFPFYPYALAAIALALWATDRHARRTRSVPGAVDARATGSSWG